MILRSMPLWRRCRHLGKLLRRDRNRIKKIGDAGFAEHLRFLERGYGGRAWRAIQHEAGGIDRLGGLQMRSERNAQCFGPLAHAGHVARQLNPVQ